jgi:hypothetical protein
MGRLLVQVKRRLVPATAVTAALLVPLAVFGGPALARSAAAAAEYEYGHHDKHGGPSKDQYGDNGPSFKQYGPSGDQYKVTICHHTHSWKHPWVQITINWHGAQAHLRHGDTTTLPCPTTPFVKDKHGHHDGGDNQGEDNGQGQPTTTVPSGSQDDDQGQGHGHDHGHGHDK